MQLNEALLAPVGQVDLAEWTSAVEALPAALAVAVSGPAISGPLRLTGHDIRMSVENPSQVSVGPQPFTWSARTAQRALGLSALRALVSGTARNPADAVRAVVADATHLSGGGARTGSSLEQWIGALPPAGRAAAGAAAVTWVTRLWCALDWVALVARGPLVIGRDHWWDSPNSSLLALRSRAEVRTGASHLVVMNGARRSSARAELSLVALVEALRGRPGSLPPVVVGWWPDSGHIVRVEADRGLLDTGVTAVSNVLRAPRRAAAA